MRRISISVQGTLFVVITFLLGWLVIASNHAAAQVTCTTSAGNNGVWGPCQNQTGITGSASFVDASTLVGNGQNQGSDLCDVIYKVLRGTIVSGFTSGGVIDARAISGTALTCSTTANTSPWFTTSGGYLNNKPSTILLPAGIIKIHYQWVVPSGTRLIGVGADLAGSQQTVIQACSTTNCFTGSAVLQFGGTGTTCSPSPCTGISVEHVTLDGANNSTTLTGIENANSQDQTYVDHVTLWQFLGTGLSIHGGGSNYGAQNSGPYTNITYDTNGAASGTAVCVNINGVSGGTHGIHGLTCKGNYSPVAVLLDSSNNSLEDVRITGFDDGIRIGSAGTARSNVLFNIVGDTNPLGVINVIRVWNAPTSISDLSIMGVANQGGAGTNTIQDALTGTTLTDPYIGMYVLGKQLSGVGYPRFTTSLNTASWIFSNTVSTPTGTCAIGSLYSNASSGALYVCHRASGWELVKN